MSKIPDDSWLKDTAVEVASMTGLPLAGPGGWCMRPSSGR